MKVLLVSARSPYPPYRGDRLRLSVWIEALSEMPDAAVTLVAPREDGSAHDLEWIEPRISIRSMASALVRIALLGLPWTCLLAARYDWHRALDQAHRRHGRFDSAIVLLSRTAAIAWPHIDADRFVLDAVDSLANAARARADAAPHTTRRLWLMEAARLDRLERSTQSKPHLTTVVARSEADRFRGDVEVLPNGVVFSPAGQSSHVFDFGFWGRLGFFANEDAARWILEEIWPGIHSRSPHSNLLIAGVDARLPLRLLAESEGVSFHSPAPDLAKLRSGVRVAVMPLRYGSGQPNKILEAIASGCAVVTTPRVANSFPELTPVLRSGTTTSEIIDHALELASDESRRRQIAGEAFSIASRHYDRAATIRRMKEIVRGPTT